MGIPLRRSFAGRMESRGKRRDIFCKRWPNRRAWSHGTFVLRRQYKNHDFKNFELKVDVMTYPGANSGIYFHTQYQESSWPKKGFEVQVNNSHTDWKRTGSLYDVVNIKEVYVKDMEWFTEYIKVDGKHVIIKINDKTVVDYTEPNDFRPAPDQTGHFLSSGTFALQGHDPNSEVHFKNIMVNVPD